MQQKELAGLLDISPAMVSRLAKRGMPTDTLERAQRWRRRHLEPGRVKGMRYERTTGNARRSAKLAPAAELPKPIAPEANAEALGDAIDGALVAGNVYGAAIRTWQLREALRNGMGQPLLSVRVWVALVGYALHEDAEVRSAPNMGALVTAEEFATLVSPSGYWQSELISTACDWDDYDLNGWPDDDEGED